MKLKQLLTLPLLLCIFLFSFACGEVPEAASSDDEAEVTQEEYEALANEEFEIDANALLDLQEETEKRDAKSDAAGGTVMIAASNLGNVQAGARTVQVARGFFLVARLALSVVTVVALANPITIAGVVVAAAVVGAAVVFAQAYHAKSDAQIQAYTDAQPLVAKGDGKYKVLTRCNIMGTGSGQPVHGRVEGIGLGHSLAAAHAVAKSAANDRCIEGTQGKHCYAQQCWKGSKPVHCGPAN